RPVRCVAYDNSAQPSCGRGCRLRPRRDVLLELLHFPHERVIEQLILEELDALVHRGGERAAQHDHQHRNGQEKSRSETPVDAHARQASRYPIPCTVCSNLISPLASTALRMVKM